MKTRVSVAAFLAVWGALAASTGAAQQVLHGNIDLNYNAYSNDDTEIDFSEIDTHIDYEINNFVLTGATSSFVFSTPGFSDSVQIFSASAGYRFTPDVMLGFGGIAARDEGFDDAVYEVFGQYDSDLLAVALNVTRDPSFDVTQFSTYGVYKHQDIAEVGVAVFQVEGVDGASYVLSADTAIAGIDGRAYYLSDTDIDAYAFGLRGTYDFGMGYRASAAFETIGGDDSPEATFYSIGGGFQVIENLWIDGKFGGGDVDGTDVRNVGIGLDFQLGDFARVDQRMNDRIAEDFRTGGLNLLTF